MNNKQHKYLMIAVMISLIVAAQQTVFAQSEPSLEATWLNEPGTRKVEFYKEGNVWFGKIIWVQNDPRVKVGDILFRDLLWGGKYFSGKVITQKGILNCTVTFEENDKININASKGAMSKSVYWSRVK
ncbi:MAG: hypothetical protein DI539_22395 [Flavobacterium psychrophilum]|nr:MAG: hypothetical protein DI539_22395 [Flavobacterium psychrophilum]